jgi:hypothetical protein
VYESGGFRALACPAEPQVKLHLVGLGVNRISMHPSFVAGLVPWAFSLRTLFRGPPRPAAPGLPVCVDARHKSLSSGRAKARTRGPGTND